MTVAALGFAGCGSGTAALSTTPTTTSPISTTGTFKYVITAQSYPSGTVVASTNFTLVVQ